MRITLALLLVSTSLVADTASRDIERFARQVLAANPDVVSVGIAVVRDGKPFYAQSFGLADLDAKTPATSKTGYYIASTTKAYTGLAAAILAERGVIDLDAPITKYLPEVKFAPPLDAGRVTLRKFLTHTAEISNDPIVFRTAFTGEHTQAELVTLLNSSKPGKPGFQYDNLGYVVASIVMERVTGKPWQRVLDEVVFTPLGMDHTSAYMSEAQRWPIASPHAITRKGNVVKLTFGKNDQMMHAAGGIVTTPEDLAKWLAANIRQKGLPAAAFKEAQRLQVETPIERGPFKGHGYGFGWYQGDYAGDQVLFHLGGYEGWASLASFMPEKKIGVAVVTNSGVGGHPVVNLIAAYVYDRLLGKPDASADMLAKFNESQKQRRERYLAEIDKRSKRPWMLQHPNSSYVGRYENAGYGTMIIEERGDKLYASLAKLNSVVEAYTEPESARVELVPGSGEVLRFVFTSGEKADALKFGDEVFQRR